MWSRAAPPLIPGYCLTATIYTPHHLTQVLQLDNPSIVPHITAHLPRSTTKCKSLKGNCQNKPNHPLNRVAGQSASDSPPHHPSTSQTMAGKKSATADASTSKKAAGQARKAATAASKQATAAAAEASTESSKWQQGARDTSKAEAARARAEEAARKKAEKAALAAADEAALPSTSRGSKKKAEKKTTKTPSRGSGLDAALASADDAADGEQKPNTDPLAATGIDAALDLLSLTSGAAATAQLERHPERRVRAAYAVFEARRLDEMKDDKTLRRGQKVEIVRKEFEKSPENPFNSVVVPFDARRDEVRAVREGEVSRIEGGLVE